ETWLIESSRPGADVYINSELVGQTPLRWDRPTVAIVVNELGYYDTIQHSHTVVHTRKETRRNVFGETVEEEIDTVEYTYPNPPQRYAPTRWAGPVTFHTSAPAIQLVVK